MVSIAVLDDGIYIDCHVVMERVKEFLVVDEYGEISLLPKTECRKVTHGGLCAYIMQNIFSDVEFTSICVLNEDGRGKGKSIAAALNWCLDRNYEIIHMSLATNSYYDYDLLKPIVSKLISKRRILVSSLSNEQIVSYPAAFPGVFAVFMDNSGFLKNSFQGVFHSYGIDKDFIMINYKNNFYTDSGENYELKEANSFAAAALTGSLAKIVQNKGMILEFENYISNLKNEGKVHEGKLLRFRSGLSNRTIPTIKIENRGRRVLECVCAFFRDKGYDVIVFSETGSDTSIPISFYLEDERIINEVFLECMETIYSPDLIILSGYLEKYFVKADIECLIHLENRIITLRWKCGKENCFRNSDEALKFLELRLQEDEL